MSKYSGIPLLTKLSYRMKLSGYSKYFKWLFNTMFKVRMGISVYAPCLIDRIIASFPLKIKMQVQENAPKLTDHIIISEQIKVVMGAVFSIIERIAGASHTIKITCTAVFSTIERIISTTFLPVKIIMTANPVVKMFYLVRDWDYKTPGTPDSERWYVSELDSKTIVSMDEKT